MVKTILFCSDQAGEADTASTTTFQHIAGELIDSTTENNHKYRCMTAGTLSQMYMRVTTASGTHTNRLRKNGGDGNQLVSVTTTGEFEDTSGTDSLDGDDEINYSLNSGAAANAHTIRFISMIFDATTNAVSLLGFQAAANYTTASTEHFKPLGGRSVLATNPIENVANCRQRKAGTFKNLGCFVSANNRTASTFKMRKNDANANLDESITASTTGWFQDTSETDTTAAGEDWNFGLLTGTGTNTTTIQVMKVEWESSNNDGEIITAHDTTQAFADNTSRFLGIGGLLTTGETANTNIRAETNVAIDFLELTCLVTANSASVGSTVTLEKDGSDTALSIAITNDGTGNFSDSSDSVAFTAAEETSIDITIPTEGGTNTCSICNIGIWTHIAASTAFDRAPETETVTMSDTVARVYGQTRTIATETVTSSESIARMLAATRNPVETTTSVETLTRLLTAFRIIDTESTTIADTVQREKGIPRSISETVTSSDSVARMLAANRTLQEDTTISETLTRLLAANRSLATETVSITDQVTRVFGAVRAITTETVSSSDSVQRLLASTRTIQTETTVITDAVARLLAANRALLESTTIADAVARTLQGPASNNFERSISETVVISESVTRMLAATRTIQTENVTSSDSVTRLLVAARQILEEVLQLDLLNRQLAASRSIQTETVSVSDSVARLLTRVRTIVENIDINESITRAFVGTRPILESIPIVDTLTRLITPFEVPTRLKKIRQWLTSNYSEDDPSLV